MNWKSTVAGICRAVFILAIGCSRAGYAAPPAAACSLLTTAQVSASLGVPVGPGKGAIPADCEWSEPRAGLRGKSVFAEILGLMGHLTPADRFNTVKAPVPFGHITKTPVSGIGDDAVYVETFGAALYVKKGSFVFQVRVQGFPLGQIKAKEKQLALDILAKL